LDDRAAMLHHADFFVGLSSGLAWLAWGAGTPVVMISGFTLPICEFRTPYRVHNTHVCHGCWDATDCGFDHKDFFWSPAQGDRAAVRMQPRDHGKTSCKDHRAVAEGS